MVKPKLYLVSSEDQCPLLILKHVLEEEFGFHVSSVEQGSSGMLKDSKKMIEESDAVIAIGSPTSNSAFELGMAYALGRPILSIFDVSYAPTGHLLTAPTEVIFPKKSMIEEIVDTLGHISIVHSERNAPA